jgi:hypothetical protein
MVRSSLGVSLTAMFHHIFNKDFPFWDFMNQPVFDAEIQFLSPAEFQKQHRVERLERCLNLTCQDRDKYPFP